MRMSVTASVVRRLSTLSVLVLIASAAAGCGQKGPLMLAPPPAASAPSR